MSRWRRSDTAPLRLALGVIVGGAIALLLPSLLTTTVDAPSAALLAAVAIAVTAAVIRLNSCAATVWAGAQAPRPPTRDEAPVLLAGRVTDPLHHPLRPRAPGPA